MITYIDVMRQYFNYFFSTEKVYSIVGVVSNIDETKRVCDVDPIDDSPILFDVRFQASESLAEGIVIVPSDGSKVTVCFINKTTATIINTSEIDKIKIKTDLVEFNDGGLDGMVTINELVTKLNNLENGYNDLVSKFNTHIHITTATVGATAVPGVIAPTVSSEPTVLTPTIKANIENTKVTQ